MSFGDRLRVARQSAGLTQADLGAATGVSNSYIAHLEKGRRAPTVQIVETLEDRLRLAPGTLEGAEAGSPDSKRRKAQATTLADFERVLMHRESGSGLETVQQLDSIIEDAKHRGRMDLAWLAQRIRLEFEFDAANLPSASGHAAELLAHARKTGDSTLVAIAETKSAVIERYKGSEGEARAHGAAAVASALHDGVTSEHRAEALSAAIAAGGPQVEEWAAMLRSIYPSLDGSLQGKTAWVLANVAMNAGQVDDGLAWQKEADQHLTPAGHFRSWVRWPTAAAEVRMNAGVLEGVPELLDAARSRVALAPNPEHAGSLASVQAQYLVATGDRSGAKAVLLDAVEHLDVGPALKGHLRMKLSEVVAAEGNLAEACAEALQAAKFYTEAGALREAQRAFEQWSELQPTG